jgi:hypothetical protein
MSALVEHIHANHVRKSIYDPACLLCEEAAAKAARQRPAWLDHLPARELETRRTVA